MKPSYAIQYISTVMCLRIPQAKSLELFANYLVSSAGQKLLQRMTRANRGNTAEILKESKAYFASIPEAKDFQEYERAFPAHTFALATGAYKDIEEVMSSQKDLVEILVKLKPLAVIKG